MRMLTLENLGLTRRENTRLSLPCCSTGISFLTIYGFLLMKCLTTPKAWFIESGISLVLACQTCQVKTCQSKSQKNEKSTILVQDIAEILLQLESTSFRHQIFDNDLGMTCILFSRLIKNKAETTVNVIDIKELGAFV